MIKILNPDEFGITYVNQMFGQLFYNKGFWGRRRTDIVKVVVLNSRIERKTYKWKEKTITISANVDLYTSSGEVIEVYTNDRKFLEACDKLTTKKDPRKYYRQQRGVL